MIERLALASLATWRIACLLYWEDGPLEVFLKLRSKARPGTFAGDLLDCFWCLSVWVGTACAVVAWSELWWTLTPFAASACALLLAGGRERMRSMLNEGEEHER